MSYLEETQHGEADWFSWRKVISEIDNKVHSTEDIYKICDYHFLWIKEVVFFNNYNIQRNSSTNTPLTWLDLKVYTNVLKIQSFTELEPGFSVNMDKVEL